MSYRGDAEARRLRIETMRVAEQRMLEEQRKLGSTDGGLPDSKRRQVLLTAGTGLVAAATGILPTGGGAHPVSTNACWTQAPDDPTRVPGRPIGLYAGYGRRSAFEVEVRRVPEGTNKLTSWSMSPLDKQLGIVTPSGLHFERYRNGIPTIDPARHMLTVHGIIKRPRRFSMVDLKRFPSVSRFHFIECNGNTSSEWRVPTMKTVQFTFVMEAKSVITFPSGEMTLPGPGLYEITGLAWSGRGKVSRVEVSVDGGRGWHVAALQEPVLPMCTTRFRFPWQWDGRPAVLQSRCIDDTGYIQPELKQLTAIRGLASHYHNNAIQSWAVASDGRVTNVHF